MYFIKPKERKYNEQGDMLLTQKEWNDTHKDFKGMFPDGTKTTLHNVNGEVCIVAVVIVKEEATTP